jgi:4-amino-4-deoxy-L-arabinose transferase-like glycosyltransferase
MLWTSGYADDVKRFFLEQNLQRAAGQLDKNKDLRIYPWVWYLRDLPAHFVPWSLFFPVAIAWSWKNRAGMSAPAKLLLCALAIPLFIMGLAGAKRSLYLLPLYPLFALWIALVWDRVLSDSLHGFRAVWKGLLITIAVVAALAAVALTVAGPMHWIRRLPPLSDTETLIIAVMAVVMVAGAVLAIRDLRRGEDLRGSLQVLAMLAVVWLGYEAAIRQAEYREDDRFAFYAEVKHTAGNRPLAWLGGRSSEAVWYLDREVPNLRLTARLKDGFFEIPGCVLIIREPELEAAPLLKKSVLELKRLELKGDYFRLVQADPDHPPDPKLFSGESGSEEDDTTD